MRELNVAMFSLYNFCHNVVKKFMIKIIIKEWFCFLGLRKKTVVKGASLSEEEKGEVNFEK